MTEQRIFAQAKQAQLFRPSQSFLASPDFETVC